MKAIFINSKDKTITEVEINKRDVLSEWYKILGVSMVEVAHYIDKSNTILVDEEGLLSANEDSKWFSYKGAHQPFVGNGLIVGVNRSGNNISCTVSLDEVKNNVSFQ